MILVDIGGIGGTLVLYYTNRSGRGRRTGLAAGVADEWQMAAEQPDQYTN
jgi:hypothetical protein